MSKTKEAMDQLEKVEPDGFERNALAEYELTPAKVAEMAKKYMKLTVPAGDNKAYKIVRAALTTCVKTRTATDKRRKELGEDARTWIAEVNQAARDLLEPLVKVEEHLKTELQNEDARKEEIKAEKARLEQERVDGIRDRIAAMVSLVTGINYDMPSDTLQNLLDQLNETEITEDIYMEFTAEALKTKSEVEESILRAIETRKKFEAEEAERKAEDERLAREREELEKAKADQEAAAKELAEKTAQLEEGKKRLEEEKRKREEEEAAKAKAEQEAKEKAEREAKEKEEREKAEAEKLARQEALKPEKEKLKGWVDIMATNLNSNLSLNDLSDEEAKIAFTLIFDLIEQAIVKSYNRIEEL